MTASPRDLARRAQELANAATPGPWYPRATDDEVNMNARFVSLDKGPGFIHDDKYGMSAGSDDCVDTDRVVAITLLQSPRLATADECDDNALFIAESRELVPALASALTEALDRSERVETQRDHWKIRFVLGQEDLLPGARVFAEGALAKSEEKLRALGIEEP